MYKLTAEQEIVYNLSRLPYDAPHNIDISNVNADVVLKTAFEQGIFGMVYERLKGQLHADSAQRYASQFLSQKIVISKTISQAAQLHDGFNSKYNIAFVKGFILSKLIYGSEYIRAFTDIDIFTVREDISVICGDMGNMGYYEKDLRMYNRYFQMSDASLKEYYENIYETHFCKDKYLTVEIKKEKIEYTEAMARNSLKNKVYTDIGKHRFCTFNLFDTFVYLVINAYSNYFTDGSVHSYKLRDMVDLYNFAVRYNDIFTPEKVEALCESKTVAYLRVIADIMREHFGGLLDGTVFARLKNLPDSGIKFYESRIPLLERIFNNRKLSDEYEDYQYDRIINGKCKMFISVPSYVLTENDFLIDMAGDETKFYDANLNGLFLDNGYNPLRMGIFKDGANFYFAFKLDKKFDDFHFEIMMACNSESPKKYLNFGFNLIGRSVTAAKPERMKVEIICRAENNLTIMVVMPKTSDIIIENGSGRSALMAFNAYPIINGTLYDAPVIGLGGLCGFNDGNNFIRIDV